MIQNKGGQIINRIRGFKAPRSFKRILIFILIAGILLFSLTFFITIDAIRKGVENNCRKAQTKYNKDCVDSLVEFVDDQENDYRSRNSAIWALGQLGEGKALPVLEKYYTGNIPNKESLDKGISQYELEKAIKLVKGGLNLGAPFWRKGLF